MAEPGCQRKLRCQWRFVGNRYAWEKLAQVYKMLVPDTPALSITGAHHEEKCSHLRAGLLGAQKEEKTIGSQTALLEEYARSHEYWVPPEWVFEDEGYSGGTLSRPALERLRDLVASGADRWMLTRRN